MRAPALFAAISAAVLATSSAVLVDAGQKTTVTVSHCSAYDSANCGSDGCNCSKTRDNKRHDASRWSCKYDLKKKPCKVCYTFEEPQDIVRMKMALYKGDERLREFKVMLDNDGVDDAEHKFKSTYTTDYENYFLYSDETQELCVQPINLGNSEWFSPTELKFMVEA